MSIVEDEWVSQRFRFDVEPFLAGDHVENLVIDVVGLDEVVFEGLLDIGVGSEHSFRAH